jgi:hypothetical protein
MRALLFLLEKLGVFCLAAFLLAFFLMLAGAIAELVYKFGLPDNNSF